MSAVIIRGRFRAQAPAPARPAKARARFGRRLAHLFPFPGSDLYSGQHAAAALQIEFLYPSRRHCWDAF